MIPSYSFLGRLALSVLPLLAVAQDKKATDSPRPYKSFNSSHISLNYAVAPKNPQELSPGNLFLSPWSFADRSFIDGPLILKNDGQLVWDGTAAPYNIRGAISYEPGTYKGKNVIGLWQGAFFPGGYGSGYGLVLDSSYNVIANISSTIQGEGVDFHEMQVKDNTALILVYAAKQTDLSYFNVTPTDGSKGWILDNYIQEIDIATGKALFTWRALDHIDPLQGLYAPGATGVSRANAWDFLHMNSVAKDSKGNYLVSARHYSTIYYISPAGKIIWQLGGRNSSFAMGEGATFHYQHDARWVEEGKRLSVFNNGAAGGIGEVEPRARTMILNLDTTNMRATLQKDFPAYAAENSPSQGSARVQSNGDVLTGYGSRSWVTEYNKSGKLLWAASYPTNVATYRISRSEWTGAPKTDPSISVTASSDNKLVDSYISWNGDSRVTSWRVFASEKKTTSSGGMKFSKMGFETKFTFKIKWPQGCGTMYVWAEGLAGDKVVGTTRRITLSRKSSVGVASLAESSSSETASGAEVVVEAEA